MSVVSSWSRGAIQPSTSKVPPKLRAATGAVLPDLVMLYTSPSTGAITWEEVGADHVVPLLTEVKMEPATPSIVGLLNQIVVVPILLPRLSTPQPKIEIHDEV